MRKRQGLLQASAVGLVLWAATTPGQSHARTASATAVTPSAQAPENAPIGDIVVTAQRRSERLQDVPVSVTAATAARLAATGIANTQDLATITPGLSMPQTAGSIQPHIRGIGSNANGPGLEAPVATYIDGVYIAAAPSALLTLNSVDRIEVLKGPQGTLFGRNATGGLIQVVTRNPTAQTVAHVDLTYASYRDVTANAYLSGKIASDVYGDVAGHYEHQGDGWGHNLATGHAVGNLPHDVAVRAKLRFAPSADTDIQLAVDYEDRVSHRDTQYLDKQYPGTFDIVAFGGPFARGKTYDINNDIDPVNSLQAGGAMLKLTQNLGDHVAFQVRLR